MFSISSGSVGHLMLKILVLASPAVTSWAQNEVDLETPAASSVETRTLVNLAPPAVQETIEQYAGNSQGQLFRQFENGRFVYEAQFVKEGILTELKIARNGTLLMKREPRVGRTITVTTPPASADTRWKPADDLPPALAKLITRPVGTNRVITIFKAERTASPIYRVTYIKDGKPVTISVNERGEVLKNTGAPATKLPNHTKSP